MFSGSRPDKRQAREFPVVCAALILLLHDSSLHMLWRGAAAAADDIEKACFCHSRICFAIVSASRSYSPKALAARRSGGR